MQRGDTPGRLARFARPRLYQQLADHISDFIEAQGLVPGDRLPPERALAAELGVSRATLSRALVALEVAGRVEVRHGDGAVVRELSGNAAALAGVLAGYAPHQLVAARESVMAGLARQAAGAPDDARRAVADAQTDGADAATLWRAVRAAAGPGPLADLDDALAITGVQQPAAPSPVLLRVAAAVAARDVEAAGRTTGILG